MACFRKDDGSTRSRSVSPVVLSGQVELPAVPDKLRVDWRRDISEQLQLEPGIVEALSLPRARARWPDFANCIQSLSRWLATSGLPDVLKEAETALMACLGANYHHDGAHYAGSAFCNLYLSEDAGLDMHFPHAAKRIPLARGTVVIFDTCQPHAIIQRGSSGFSAEDFAGDPDLAQVFLTWELPIENPHLLRALDIVLDVDDRLHDQQECDQVLFKGAPFCVCPESGLLTQATSLHA